MSSFTCEHCGTAIIETNTGYVTECEHYPRNGEHPMTQDSLKPKITCHADGDRCLGCKHYYGKAPVCEFAKPAVQGGELVKRIKSLLGEIVSMHADPESGDYNECDKVGEECLWCAQAKEALAALSPPADRVKKNDPDYPITATFADHGIHIRAKSFEDVDKIDEALAALDS